MDYEDVKELAEEEYNASSYRCLFVPRSIDDDKDIYDKVMELEDEIVEAGMNYDGHMFHEHGAILKFKEAVEDSE